MNTILISKFLFLRLTWLCRICDGNRIFNRVSFSTAYPAVYQVEDDYVRVVDRSDFWLNLRWDFSSVYYAAVLSCAVLTSICSTGTILNTCWHGFFITEVRFYVHYTCTIKYLPSHATMMTTFATLDKIGWRTRNHQLHSLRHGQLFGFDCLSEYRLFMVSFLYRCWPHFEI